MKRPSAKEIIFWITVIPKVWQLIKPWFDRKKKEREEKRKQKDGSSN